MQFLDPKSARPGENVDRVGDLHLCGACGTVNLIGLIGTSEFTDFASLTKEEARDLELAQIAIKNRKQYGKRNGHS